MREIRSESRAVFLACAILIIFVSLRAFAAKNSAIQRSRYQRYPKNCEYLLTKLDLVESRLGRTFQRSASLREEGYFSKKTEDSSLCGPSVIADIATKFRTVFSVPSRWMNEQEELKDIVDTLGPSLGERRRKLIDYGITEETFEKMLKVHLENQGFRNVRIEVFFPWQRPNLLAAFEDNSAVAISSLWWKPEIPFAKRSEENASYAHFTSLAGLKETPQGPMVYFADPYYQRYDSARKLYLLRSVDLPEMGPLWRISPLYKPNSDFKDFAIYVDTLYIVNVDPPNLGK